MRAGEVWQWASLPAVSSVWGKSHQMFGFGEDVKILASRFAVQKHVPFHLMPPKGPKLSKAVFFSSHFSDSPSQRPFVAYLDLVELFLLLLLYILSFQAKRFHYTKLRCVMVVCHPCLASYEPGLHSYTNGRFHGNQWWGARENVGVCVCVVGCRLTLGVCPRVGFTGREGWV